jgi:hypothetical protein
VQPEWFYKGNGYNVVPPEHPLVSPPFALDGGEEAELVGLYVIAESGEILRLGFALGNEFSDHVMEAKNYLYLAHSKLRACSFGPELILGAPPAEISGQVRIERNGQTLWEAPFLTGEERMSYSISNLEHHHFKYDLFRKPGDVHCHFFGTSTLSRNAGVVTQPGDRFEISASGFGRPLRNTLEQAPEDHKGFRARSLYKLISKSIRKESVKALCRTANCFFWVVSDEARIILLSLLDLLQKSQTPNHRDTHLPSHSASLRGRYAVVGGARGVTEFCINSSQREASATPWFKKTLQ